MNINYFISKKLVRVGSCGSLLFGLFFACEGAVQADEFEFGLSFSGFGTLGVVHNSSDTLKFHNEFTVNPSDNIYAFNADTLLGLQLNAELPARFDAVVQVILKDRVSNDTLDSLELFFLRYRPTRHWALRLGRTSTDIYMLSEYRNVGYAYLWVRPITEFYLRSSSIAKIDGLDLSYTFDVGEGVWENKLAYGYTQTALSASIGTLELDIKNMFVFTSIYTNYPWVFRLAIVDAKVDKLGFATNELVAGLNQMPAPLWLEASDIAGSLDGPGQALQYYAIGMQYDKDNWIIQSELGYTSSEWGLTQPYYNGYVSVGYRIEDWTLYTSAARVDNSDASIVIDPPQLPMQLPPQLIGQINGLYAGAQQAFNSSRVDQWGYSVGARWDLYPNTSLKIQWDHTRVDMDGNSLWFRTQPQIQNESINLFSLNFSFIFSL